MNETELRRAYAALLDDRRPVAGARTTSDAPTLDRMLALIEGRGSETERLATLDRAMADPATARELELLRSIAATHRAAPARARWGVAAPLLAAAAAIGLLALPARDALRRTSADPVRNAVQVPVLVAPAEIALAADSRTYRWRSVPGARSYALEILTAAGTPVFTTRTGDTTVTLPADVQLRPGTEHQWWVVSELADGTQRRSAFRRLQVRRPR